MTKKHFQLVLIIISFFTVLSFPTSSAKFGSGAVGALMESALENAVNHLSVEKHSVEVTIEGEGTVTKEPNLQKYPHQRLITLEAFPAAGWQFDHWEGDFTDNSNPFSFLVEEDINLTAIFIKNEYSLSVNITGEGSVTVEPDEDSYGAGTEITLTATADSGWSFAHWEGDDTSNDNPLSILMEEDTNLTAVFIKNEYSLSVNITGEGSVTVEPDEDSYDAGTEITLTATADSGWSFDHWEGDSTSNDNPLSIPMVEDTNLTAVFIKTTLSMQMISAGFKHSLALGVDGTVWAWGDNTYGQLGEDSAIDKSSTPIKVDSLENMIALAAGGNHCLALKEDGTVWAWGNNERGQLGNGTNDSTNIPVQVNELENVISIAAGGSHSLALTEEGEVWAWGNNYDGQLGDETDVDKNSPVKVNLPDVVKTIAAGGSHSLALTEEGEVWAWGNNHDGQFGDGSYDYSLNFPIEAKPITNVTELAAGHYHSLAMTEEQKVWAWGRNSTGQLGDGTGEQKTSPVQIDSLVNITQIAGGTNHSLFLGSDGKVRASGDNSYKQLGVFHTNYSFFSTVIVEVENLENVIAIAGGNGHSLALKEEGTVWTWGRNDEGQLGYETEGSAYLPQQTLFTLP